MKRERIHFITGRLAEHSLRAVLAQVSPRVGFDFTIDVLPITVAALMTPEWIARHLKTPIAADRLIVPGYCQGNLTPIETAARVPVQRGPRDLRRLDEFFTGRPLPADYGAYDIEIIAEINHCPRLSLLEILSTAAELRAAGADVIDVGCDPGEPWSGVFDCVRALREAGHRVSIDSLNVREIEPAARAGAELVLSVNSTNREATADWGCEVIVTPDEPGDWVSLEQTVEHLASHGVRLRIDPILEPIGFGFANSLQRYWEARRRFPDAEMMMGIGNLTELTDADSAGINVLLLGYCQDLSIRSVLTTQVINWARSSVRECDLARRLVYHAVQHRVLPKHLEPSLVMLRDASPTEIGTAAIEELSRQVKDHNYRVFAEAGQIHVVSAGLHLADADPFTIFERLAATGAKHLDASHAFYLGYEMAKAATALTLSKEYRQDEALDWGFLTRPEVSHRTRRSRLPEPWETK